MATTGILQISPPSYPGNGPTMDLSQYMDVQAGDGMDPANPAFTQRIFSHALLKEGGVQALQNLQLKEMQFPLILSATTRDGTTELIQSINTLVNAGGQTAMWQDQGSSEPTFFDLAAGQIDVQYDFRRAGAFYIKGLLRLFVQPLGHTATMRLVASAAGSGPLLTLPVASPIMGDAGALVHTQITAGNWLGGTNTVIQAHQAVVGVIGPGYLPEWRVPSMTNIPAYATVMGGSGAVASQFVRGIYNEAASPVLWLAQIALPTTTPYLGVNRVLAIARANATAVVQTGIGGVVSGPTTIIMTGIGTTSATCGGWELLDLGTFTVPSSAPYPTSAYSLYLFANGVATGATVFLDVTDLILLPDNQAAFVDDSAFNGFSTTGTGALFTFDGVLNESYTADRGGAFVQRLTPVQRGAIPQIFPGASQQLVVVVQPKPKTDYEYSTAPAPANDILSATVTVRERVRFSF